MRIRDSRFTSDGAANRYTVVDGEPYPMEDNDLVLTPGWTWHDHHNESDKPAIWLDVLDVPLVAALNQAFYQSFGEDRQPLADDARAMTARTSFTPEVTAESASNAMLLWSASTRASVVLPVPGGPQNTRLGTLPCANAVWSSEPLRRT